MQPQLMPLLFFGKMVRSNFQKEMNESTHDEETTVCAAPKYSAPSQGIDIGSLEACTVAENEGGEEDIRAALTCFFLHMYGDMGMYLSETQGTFWLDRRKYLLRKKQEGEKENSPTFLVLKKFSSVCENICKAFFMRKLCPSFSDLLILYTVSNVLRLRESTDIGYGSNHNEREVFYHAPSHSFI